MKSIGATFEATYINSAIKEIQNSFLFIKEFNQRGIYRMMPLYKIYETYCKGEFVSSLLIQITF